MINELAGSLTRSKNVYFANNEQASIVVYAAVFCFALAEHLIKLNLKLLNQMKLNLNSFN